jgi:GNAT superfamily N-acetyltransferase
MARFTVEEIPLGDRRLRKFVSVPWHIYRGDPHWTPPLRGELLGSRVLGLTGLLTPAHPYHRDAEVTHFLARSGATLLGRVSASINRRFNAYHTMNLGFFGFFESVPDYAVTEGLLDSARAWLAARGVAAMRGPGGYSNATHESHQAVLVHGFDTPPTVELTHNPPYYREFFERYGLRKVKDYHAYWVAPSQAVDPRLERLMAAVRGRRRIETRPLDMRRLRSEVQQIVRIYNEAWAANWGFLPVTDDEASALAKSLKMIADPDLIRFAYVEGESAGVIGAIPDPNVALRPRWNPVLDLDLVRALRLVSRRGRIRTARVMFFGICPPYRKLGVDAVLLHEVFTVAWEKGYRAGEASMLLEDNDLILRETATLGGALYKTWRVYEMPVA